MKFTIFCQECNFFTSGNLFTMSNDNLNISSTQQPPKKKRKKSTYWLVKIPRWLGDEWFNDNKYQPGTQLGQFCAVPRDDTNTDELDIKLQISNPPSPINPKTQTSNSSVKQLEYIPIPSHFRMDEREKRHRINVKHGELQKLGADKLLLFHDKPSFPIGSKVEAFDASRLDQNHNDTDEEDDDIIMNKKSTNTFNGYAKGVIKGINNDRTYTVEFDESHQQRYQVPEKDIRFIDAQQAKKANKCKLQGIIKSEMDVQPEWNKRYQDYLQKRAMNDKFCQKFVIVSLLHVICNGQ